MYFKETYNSKALNKDLTNLSYTDNILELTNFVLFQTLNRTQNNQDLYSRAFQ